MEEKRNSNFGNYNRALEIEEDDNFLDDLMSDVMSSGSPEPVAESRIEDEYIEVEEENHQQLAEGSNRSRERVPRRRGGLFGVIDESSIADEPKELGTIQEEVVERSERKEPTRRRSLLGLVVEQEEEEVVVVVEQEYISESEEVSRGEIEEESFIEEEISGVEIRDYSERSNHNESNYSEEVHSTEVEEEPELTRYSGEVEYEEDISYVEADSRDYSDYSREQEEVVVNDEYFSAEEIEETKEIEDNFDGMFGGFLEDDNEPIGNNSSIEEVDSGVEVVDAEVVIPLEKPGMDSIIVTSDGRSLSEMLPSLRSGKKKSTQMIADIRKNAKIEEENGRRFNDSRYTSHIEKIEKESAEDKKRVELSLKFLQRNANFTEQEKIIMKNLGLTNEQLVGVMKSKELTLKEKKEMLGLGRYGAEKHFKGRKYKTTVGDMAMLEFLVKFKFANTRILKWISNESQNRTWRKLNRLRDSGLAESKTIIGIPDLFGATDAGVAISGYALNPGLRPMPKNHTISSTMGVNYLAACLWFNTVNVLNLDDFPAHNKVIALQEDGRDRVRGEVLVSELEIRSSLGKEINPMSTTMQTLGENKLYDVISSNVRREFNDWELSGKVYESPEFSLGNEYMWILYPEGALTLSYHVPDLVVKRDRGPNGEPNSIAVELERYDKSSDKYEKVMLAYKLDEHLYKEVVWVTPNSRTARALVKAAKEVGFTRYRIIPIVTETGSYNKADIWMI